MLVVGVLASKPHYLEKSGQSAIHASVSSAADG